MAAGKRPHGEHGGGHAVDPGGEHVLDRVEPVDVAEPEKCQRRQHENPDPCAEVAAVHAHEKLEPAGQRQPHRRRRAAVRPGRDPRLQRKQPCREQNQPGHEDVEPLRRQTEHQRRTNGRTQGAGQDKPAGPDRYPRAAAAARPRGDQRGGPEAERARGIRRHQLRGIGGQNRGQDGEGQDCAAAGDGVHRSGEERCGRKDREAARSAAKAVIKPGHGPACGLAIAGGTGAGGNAGGWPTAAAAGSGEERSCPQSTSM